MKRCLAAVLAVVLAAVFVCAAVAEVRVTKRPGRVSTGDIASVTASAAPKTRCTIGVYYSTTASRAAGLGRKRGTKITWTWRVGSDTKPGTRPVKIDCGKSGKTQTGVTVRR